MKAEIPPFSERNYLRLLAGKTSSSWANELKLDGGIELELDPILQPADLVEPLRTCVFPTIHIENLDDVLSSILMGYLSGYEDRETIDEFKVIYVASLYLHCHAGSAKTTGVTNLACALIARCAAGLPTDEKLQVYAFLLWIFDKEKRSADYRLDFPKTSILLCAYIVSADSNEPLMEKANAAFHAELAAVGTPPRKAAIKPALEEAAKIEPSLDAQIILDLIGEASPLHETCMNIFRGVLEELNLDTTKIAMLKPPP